MITYELPEDLGDKTNVNVKFVNEKGEIYIKLVNIPRDDEGSIIQDEFNNILEGQLRGIENKLKIGSIKFEPQTRQTPAENIPDTVKDTSN
jgi:hypothetical protein